MSGIKHDIYTQDNPDMKGFDEDPVLAEWTRFCIIPFIKPKEHYTLFNNRIRIVSGWLSVSTREIQFKKIEQVSMRTSFIGRLFNVGDVLLTTKVLKNMEIPLHVKNPEEIMAIINQALFDEKQAYLRSKGKGENHYSHRNEQKKNYRKNGDKKGKNGEDQLDVIRNIAP